MKMNPEFGVWHELAERVREDLERGMTQREIAEKHNVSQATVSHWKTALKPALDKRRKVC